MKEIEPKYLPFIRKEEENWKSTQEAARDVWQKYGPKDIHSYEDYLAAKKIFDSTPQIEVMIRGGGPSALLMTRQLLNSDPRIHITILEKADRLGGMGINAISPFVDNHIDTILAQQRLIFQTLAEPRVDVLTNLSVEPDQIPLIAQLLGAQFSIDAAGTEPNRLKGITYGKFVMTSNDYLDMVNGPFNEDGHFGAVNVPTKRDAGGKPYPTIVAAGGNQSRDLQKAGELVFLADRWERELGLPKNMLDIEKVSAEGVRKSRLRMGLSDDSQQETMIIYRGLDWKMKKLLKGVGSLEYGDPELRQAMGAEMWDWQQEDGGNFRSLLEIAGIKETTEGPLEVTIKNNNNNTEFVTYAGNVVTAIRFEPRPEQAKSILVGIAVEGAADLSSTGLYIVKKAIPRVKKELPALSPLFKERAKKEETDPILEAMQKGPQYLIKIGFRKQGAT